MRKYFKILEIKMNASLEEVKRAYKTQAKKWHPDRFHREDPEIQKKAQERFQKISDAFQKIQEITKQRLKDRYSEEQPDQDFQRPFSNADSDPFEDFPDFSNTPPSSETEAKNAAGYFYRTWPNGGKYEGQLQGGMMHGMGILISANGDKYTGQFRFGSMSGQGKMVFANGDNYSGEFMDNAMGGRGSYNYSNGDRFIGYFMEDLPHGEGAHILASGEVYAGNWDRGRLLA